MSYLLGLDLGTSGARAVLVDAGGRVRATATAEYPLSQPRPLWSEQDPADWWRGAREALRAVLARNGGAARRWRLSVSPGRCMARPSSTPPIA